MKHNFLGRGIGFPLRLTNRGNLAMSAEERSIEESIHMIVGTAPGERVMRPDFGCNIHSLIFKPNNANTGAQASYYVQDALVKWEPRIRNVQVEARPDPMKENVMRVAVTYRVIATNNIRNTVYPFYLRKEEAL